MTPTSIDDIQTRIQEIQQRLGLQTAAQNTSSSTTSSSAFNDVLSSMMGGTGSADSLSSDDILSLLNGSSTDATTSGAAVVADAKKYLGVPYVWGGTNPATGLDCSGLVQKVYSDMGISLPRVAADQAKQGTPVASLAQAQPGDLVAFGSPVNHIGIYAGDGKMVVAPKKGDVVKVEDVYTAPTAIRRILPSATAASGAANSTLTTSASKISLASLSNLTNTLSGASSAGFGSLSSQYNSLFSTAGAKYGISPTLLAAVAKQESGFNASAGSSAGAQGLMQLMPSTAKGLGVTNPYDPAQAVDGAAKMLSGLQKQFGSTSLALAAYNAGSGAVQKYNGIPPYKETQNYVKNILAMTSANGVSV